MLKSELVTHFFSIVYVSYSVLHIAAPCVPLQKKKKTHYLCSQLLNKMYLFLPIPLTVLLGPGAVQIAQSLGPLRLAITVAYLAKSKSLLEPECCLW